MNFTLTSLTILLMVLSWGYIGCSSGHCRVNEEKKKAEASGRGVQKNLVQKGGVTVTRTNAPTVFVFKYDGTLQCGQGKQIPIEYMKKELDGIPVYSQNNKSDGVIRPQQCGLSTGMAHVFEIPQADLKKALSKGFTVWESE